MIRLVLVASLVSFSASDIPHSSLAAQVAETPTAIVIQGKFDTATEHVLIPVGIGGHEFWCNPDSGFSALIALDQTKAVAAGLTVAPGIRTPDGNAPSPGDSSTNATVAVGSVTFPNQPIILRRFPEEAPDMDCIMGVALLRRFVVEFDHMTPRLILYERGTYRPSAGTETVPLLFRTNLNVPYLDVQITLPNGSRLPLRMVPDTGAAFYAAALVGSAVGRVELQLRSAPAITYQDPQADRVTRLVAARPSAITVGPFTVREPVIAFVRGTLGGGGIADGVLGSGFLRRFTVGFDFDGRVMYLRPNSRLAQPQSFDASGVGFIRRGGRHVVYEVIADSPASEAGVRVGDVLLEIDGRTATPLTAIEIRELLTAAGTTRRLLIQREEHTVTILLALTRRI
jgi:hypothetical protein